VTILSLTEVRAGYGAIRALHGVSIEVREGSVVALLGANGAGKSTVLRVASAMLPIESGQVVFDNRRVVGQMPNELVRRGLLHVPEGRHLFADLTVDENLRMGAYLSPRREVNARTRLAYDLFPRLAERGEQLASTLSGGEQQMLVIGRAIAGRPRMLLIDEASLGLAPLIVEAVYEVIETIAREHGVTTLFVEQNASTALRVADYVYLLEAGRIVESGESSAFQEQDALRKSYLGY
jgi:branched-chain amino acid transport system ATP-binding protein